MKEYDAAVKAMQKKMDKAKPKSKDLCMLMKDTFPIRKRWIEENHPSVSDTLMKFPALRKHKIVSFITEYTFYVCVLFCS